MYILLVYERELSKGDYLRPLLMTIIKVESVVKYSLVLKGMQMRYMGQYDAELTLSP